MVPVSWKLLVPVLSGQLVMPGPPPGSRLGSDASVFCPRLSSHTQFISWRSAPPPRHHRAALMGGSHDHCPMWRHNEILLPAGLILYCEAASMRLFLIRRLIFRQTPRGAIDLSLGRLLFTSCCLLVSVMDSHVSPVSYLLPAPPPHLLHL